MRPHAAVAAVAMLAACTLAPAPADTPGGDILGTLPPPGYGTLRLDEISILLVSGDLEIMVTPLDEAIIRVAAPDTYRRMSGMADAYRASAPPGSSLFLVSFYSEQADVLFVPEEVQLISRGLRIRPGTITPIATTWGRRRLKQRQTETAIYSFVGTVDIESDLVLVYGLDQTHVWSAILPRIQQERARARARARANIGGGNTPAKPR